MKKLVFPHEIKKGSVSIKIYKSLSHGCESFTLSYYRDGVRKRPSFASFQKALVEAEHVAEIMASSQGNVFNLTASDGAAYRRARQILDPLDIPIELAAFQFAEAQRRMRNIPLIKAVDFYLSRHPSEMPPKTVSFVLEEMLQAKKSDGLSSGYLRHLNYDLKKFADSFHCDIGAVVGTDVDTWLRGLKIAPRTRNNLRSGIQTLFAFAKTRRYLPKDHDEIDSVLVAKDRGGAIEIFTPSEFDEFLRHADKRIISFLTLGAFAGIRHSEIQRLDWKDINFDSGMIEIRANMAKTASRRIIPLMDNLRSWLEPYRQNEGSVCAYRNMASEISRTVRHLNDSRKKQKITGKFAWKHNALRHSFISYRLAQIQNTAQVALEAGNSPQMIFRHYRELVRLQDAEAWFSMFPK
jgi:integrase